MTEDEDGQILRLEDRKHLCPQWIRFLRPVLRITILGKYDQELLETHHDGIGIFFFPSPLHVEEEKGTRNHDGYT